MIKIFETEVNQELEYFFWKRLMKLLHRGLDKADVSASNTQILYIDSAFKLANASSKTFIV